MTHALGFGAAISTLAEPVTSGIKGQRATGAMTNGRWREVYGIPGAGLWHASLWFTLVTGWLKNSRLEDEQPAQPAGAQVPWIP